MVQELERLRKLLDVTPADQLRKDVSGVFGSDAAYAGALNAAEVCERRVQPDNASSYDIAAQALLLHRTL